MTKALLAVLGGIAATLVVWGVAAAAVGGEIRGIVTSAVDARPVAGVIVSLQGPAPAQQTTDRSGRYDFRNLPPGTYFVDTAKAGYSTSSSGDLSVRDGRVVVQSFTVAPTSLKVLGQVRVSSRPVLQTAPQVYTDVGVQQIRDQGITRVSDYLRNLPGVNSFTTATPGDDVGLNLRGFNNLETLALINGHYLARNEDRYGMNYSDTPIFGLKSSQVVYGAGAVGFYGVDAVGGIINLQTIEPTVEPENTFNVGLGTYNQNILGFQSTGTQGKLGYAVAYGQSTTDGPIDHRFVFNVPYGNALGCASPGAPTCGFYVVDQTTVRRSGVLSLRLAPDASSSLTLTGITMHAWDDGSGNGANDMLLGQFAGSPGQQGPQGSGPVWLDTGINDGEIRYAKQMGQNLVVVDGFQSHFNAGRNYQFNIPPAWSQGFSTVRGLTVSDQIFVRKHTVGLGYYTQAAHDYLDSFSQDPSTGTISAAPFDTNYVNNNVFFKDEWQVSSKFAVDSNLWVKHSTLTHTSHLDPRVALVDRPTSNDVVRLSASGGQTYPSAFVTASTFNPIATVNFVCGTNGQSAQAQIGNAPSVTALPETSRDIELSYGHRSGGGATLQANVYDTVLYNQLLGTAVAASTFGPNYLPPGYLAQLNGPRNPCGQPITPDNVIATVTENLGRSRYRGMEADTSYPLTHTLAVNAAYNIQIATPDFVDQSVYSNSPGLIIGSQYFGVPQHKGSLGLRLDDPRGVSGDLIGYFSSANNPNNLPGYVMVNSDMRLKVGPGHVVLSAVNMLGKHVYDYGLQFVGLSQAQQAGTASVPTELFGLPPPSASIQYEITAR
ncbi:MAG: TonB-dependent receptor [Candidatus Eremiobacteraeota bacterium]|nr:TonB-dependent receptor [Candidatus Eremiobacteraeota bacterium]